MGFRLLYLEEALAELEGFSKKEAAKIVKKLEKVASDAPGSFRLKTVVPIRGAERLPDGGKGLEIKIGDGYRAATVVFEDRQMLVVYLVGDHNYVTENYIKLGEARGIFEGDLAGRVAEGPEELGPTEERPGA